MGRKAFEIVLYLTVWLAFSIPVWVRLAFFFLFT